jgi:glycerophosphoryl diester phosphodiesterase
MERMLAWGVDGLITNRPDLAVTVRDAFMGAVPAITAVI